MGPTVEVDPDEWDRIMAVNAKGAFLLCRSAIPYLLKTKGNIVFTGSYTGEQGQVERAAYSASKGALRLFTQSLALELAPQGIRVNGVAPAYVESALVRLGLEQAASRQVSRLKKLAVSVMQPSLWVARPLLKRSPKRSSILLRRKQATSPGRGSM